MMLLLEPPAQYDHPYHGQVIEQRLSQFQLMQLCHGPAPACAWVSKGVCHVALPVDEKNSRVVAIMRRHEVAHCNGWPPHHPGGHWVELDESGKHVTARKTGHLYWGLF
jgi:hypothetical protein